MNLPANSKTTLVVALSLVYLANLLEHISQGIQDNRFTPLVIPKTKTYIEAFPIVIQGGISVTNTQCQKAQSIECIGYTVLVISLAEVFQASFIETLSFFHLA